MVGRVSAKKTMNGDILDPVRALAASVVLQAIADTSMGIAHHGTASTVTTQERDQARLFLTAGDGAWARARRFWCALADIDPDILRQTVVTGRLARLDAAA